MPSSPLLATDRQGGVPAGANLDFSPEFKWLLACCAVDGSGRVRQFPVEAANWQQVLALADFHGVTPVIHAALNDSPSREREVSTEIRNELRARFEQNVRKNLRMAAELMRVLDCLERAGIAAIPYKGVALAELLYGDIALREFSDLDVLVRASDVPRARTALAQIGFRPNLTLTTPQEQAYLAAGYEYTFDGPAGKNLLEVQWNFVPRFFAVDFGMEDVFRRCVTGAVSGRTTRLLCDGDLLLALSVHAAKHLWRRLCWIRDIAALVQKPGLDAKLVMRASERLGVRRIVDVSLSLAERLLGANVPSALQSSGRFRDQSLALYGEVQRRIPTMEVHSTESIEYFRWMLRLREHASDRALFLARLALTPSVGEWQSVKLPGPLFPLYRVVRLGRLARRLVGGR
jgi:hypothetical protein